MFWIILILLVAVFFLLRKKKMKVCESDKKPNTCIDQYYEVQEGKFIIEGTKDDFTVQKDDDLIFTVVNGKIVSVTDKKNSHVYEVE